MTGLPMFPLGNVLLPSMVLPLHVFEPRYRALARDCVAGDRQLGVVLIERGREVGGGDARFDVGTRGRLVEAVELDDGRWLLVVLGEDRVRVRQWLGDDPYPRAEVEACPERSAGPTAAGRRDDLDALLRRALVMKAELGDPLPDPDFHAPLSADPALATWQAVSRAPLGPLDTQRVLETDGADDRLDLVLALLDDEVGVLAQRLAGG